jgi:soluble lytic murein transglycosylase-like protein
MAGLGMLERLAYDALPKNDSVRTSESTASMLRFRRSAFGVRSDERPEPEASVIEQTDIAAGSDHESLVDVIYAAAVEFGIEGAYLLSVAECESNLNPGAYNAAGYHGLFQFDSETWSAYGYGSIYDPVAQARTAARLLAAGQTSRWPVCS